MSLFDLLMYFANKSGADSYMNNVPLCANPFHPADEPDLNIAWHIGWIGEASREREELDDLLSNLFSDR